MAADPWHRQCCRCCCCGCCGCCAEPTSPCYVRSRSARRRMWLWIACTCALLLFTAAWLHRTVDSGTALRAILPVSQLSLERVTVPIHGLPPRLHGARVVQLTDVHSRHALDPATRALWGRVIDTVQREKPDLVVVTGDLVDYDLSAISVLIPMLKRLQSFSRCGLYVTLGNHDYYQRKLEGAAELQRALADHSIPVLINATAFPFARVGGASGETRVDAAAPAVCAAGGGDALSTDALSTDGLRTTTPAAAVAMAHAERIGALRGAAAVAAAVDEVGPALVGLGDVWGHDFHPEAVYPALPHALPRIVLSHNPDTAWHLRSDTVDMRLRNARKLGFGAAAAADPPPRDVPGVRSDLILSGHTHGGQICLPAWARVTGGRTAPGANRGRALLPALVWLDSALPQWLSRLLPGRKHFRVIKNWRWMQGLFEFARPTETTAGSYLYVSRGLADVHRRLFCDPELTIFTLHAVGAAVPQTDF